MGSEQPSLEVLVERIGNVQSDVSEIKQSMATRNDQAVTERQLMELTAALAAERVERLRGIEKEQAARASAVAEEKRERIDAIDREAKLREALAARVQTTEDREEQRKWWLLTAILTGGLGLIWNIVQTAISQLGAS